MSISTFFGLQTSLRGLLAQQRALDITGAQHRQREHRRLHAPGGPLGAADPLRRCRPAPRRTAPARSSARASTSTTYRRVRDGFLDLQYRAQNMALGDATDAAPRRSTRCRARSASPSTTGINALLGKF